MHVVFNHGFETSDFPGVAASMKSIFHKHGIHSVAIQPEFLKEGQEGEDCERSCLLSCEPTCESENICCNDRLTYRARKRNPSAKDMSTEHELTQFLL